MPRPKPFLVRPPSDGRGWSVKQGNRWRFAADLVIQVTVCNIDNHGEAALEGIGVVRTLSRGRIVVTA